MPATLNALFFEALENHRGLPAAYRHKVHGKWEAITHDELRQRVYATYAALRGLGLGDGDRVAIISENRIEWALADYACLAARCADVPVYPTLPTHHVEHLLRDSGSKAVFCSTSTQLEKVREIRDRLPDLKHVVVFDAGLAGPGEMQFSELEESGARATDRWPDWQADALEAEPDDLATLIYTSGTTGDPKGVMLSHGNISSNVD